MNSSSHCKITHNACWYLVVCHVGPMMGRENQIGNLIWNLLVTTSVVMGLGSLLQPGHTHVFLLCMGRQEHFIMDLENIFQPFIRGIETKLPIYYPLRLGLHLSVFSFIRIVPLLYFKIFMFRRSQDTSIKGKEEWTYYWKYLSSFVGISELQRRIRKNTNFVSTTLNCVAWVFQVNKQVCHFNDSFVILYRLLQVFYYLCPFLSTTFISTFLPGEASTWGLHHLYFCWCCTETPSGRNINSLYGLSSQMTRCTQ